MNGVAGTQLGKTVCGPTHGFHSTPNHHGTSSNIVYWCLALMCINGHTPSLPFWSSSCHHVQQSCMSYLPSAPSNQISAMVAHELENDVGHTFLPSQNLPYLPQLPPFSELGTRVQGSGSPLGETLLACTAGVQTLRQM